MAYYPQKVVWEITYKCNINCIHCGSDCTSVEKEHQLTTAECFDVIADLAQLGCELVILSGGEPMIRKDISAIATAVRRQGMRVAFISNGTLLNERNMKWLKAVRPEAFGMSLDAGTRELHDYIRGKEGVFDNLFEKTKLLQDNGIHVSIVTTVHKLNFSELPKIRQLLMDNNIRLWQIQYGDFIGRMPKEAMITEAQFLEMAKFILDTRENYKDYFDGVSGADGFGYMGELGTTLQGAWYGCFAGIRGLGLGSDGTVRGCLSLQMDEYKEDNVRNRSLVDIWNDKNSFAYNRHFDCSMLTGHCKDCVYAGVCKGGCVRAATVDGGRCDKYCLYHLEENGFSNEEQSRTNFSKQEIYDIYNPIRPLPENYFEL